MAVLRSPYAHARITSIDLSGALASPGVVAAYTGADLAGLWAAPMPCAWPVTPDMKNPAHYPIAIGKACYVGDGVAVVLAHTNAAARDALEAIVVEYEALPAVIGLEDSLSDRVVIHDELGTNKSYTWELHPQGKEAVDAVFASAAHVVKERYVQQRLIPMAMEPRAVAAVPQPFGGDITLYSATQVPHILKVMAALTLGIPEHQMRVVAPAVGGGFGSKLNVYAEELLCTALARKHGVPVRWCEERSENTVATIHGRGQIQTIELAAVALEIPPRDPVLRADHRGVCAEQRPQLRPRGGHRLLQRRDVRAGQRSQSSGRRPQLDSRRDDDDKLGHGSGGGRHGVLLAPAAKGAG